MLEKENGIGNLGQGTYHFQTLIWSSMKWVYKFHGVLQKIVHVVSWDIVEINKCSFLSFLYELFKK